MSADVASVQRWIARVVREPRSLVASEVHRAEADRCITGSGRLTALQQLEIYREQFWFRHTASLVEDFPGLVRSMRQPDWERLVEGYLVQHPPHSSSLRHLGAGFPEYVAQQAWLEEQSMLADMARLELAYLECFDARDSERLDTMSLSQLSAEDWEAAALCLTPALRLLQLRHDVAAERRRLLSKSSVGEASDLKTQRNVFLAVFRGPDRELWDKSLSEGAFQLLKALEQGRSLAVACDLALTLVPDAAQEFETQLAQWFTSWARWGWICDVRRGAPGQNQ